jgi:beta-lactamase regulating signal transducer with metallopeptidase domain
MASEILQRLLAVSLTSTAVILLLCAVRVRLRHAFGARLAYLAWIAVPATLVISLLPAAHMPATIRQVVAPLRHLANVGMPEILPVAAPWQQLQQGLMLACLTIWLLVAMAALAWLWRAHLAYRRQLGPLRWQDGVWHSATEGPAVIGLWRPMVVVPADFTTRYALQEQQLILAHEAVHVRRRDPLMNALCALLQCALWFHPLVHLAARRFRLDQELACDAAVMQAHPALKRSYGEAMLKTQMSHHAALIHCHWQTIHPLKERIMQLQQTSPSRLRRLLGRVTISALVATCGYGAMAANAGVESADRYMVKMTLSVNGAISSPALLVQEGVPASVISKGSEGVWRTELTLKKSSGDEVFVKTVIRHDERIISSPGFLVSIGEDAAVTVDNDFKLQLNVALNKPRD